MVKIAEDKKDTHVHVWRSTLNPTEMRCECKKILISKEEFDRRAQEWESYYTLIPTTQANRDYLEMKQAYQSRDLKKMKEIREKVLKRGHWATNKYEEKVWEVDKTDLETPNFPDPIGNSWRYIVG